MLLLAISRLTVKILILPRALHLFASRFRTAKQLTARLEIKIEKLFLNSSFFVSMNLILYCFLKVNYEPTQQQIAQDQKCKTFDKSRNKK